GRFQSSAPPSKLGGGSESLADGSAESCGQPRIKWFQFSNLNGPTELARSVDSFRGFLRGCFPALALAAACRGGFWKQPHSSCHFSVASPQPPPPLSGVQ